MSVEKPSLSLPLWLAGVVAAGTALGLFARSRYAAGGPARSTFDANRPGRSDAGEAAGPDDVRPFGASTVLRMSRATTSVTRAREPGRGRGPPRRVEIPLTGWRDIAWRVVAGDRQNDRLLAVAAGVVFYGLLALFPAITALVSSYALFSEAATIGQHLGFRRSPDAGRCLSASSRNRSPGLRRAAAAG